LDRTMVVPPMPLKHERLDHRYTKRQCSNGWL
jgi:hypothetical protein